MRLLRSCDARCGTGFQPVRSGRPPSRPWRMRMVDVRVCEHRSEIGRGVPRWAASSGSHSRQNGHSGFPEPSTSLRERRASRPPGQADSGSLAVSRAGAAALWRRPATAMRLILMLPLSAVSVITCCVCTRRAAGSLHGIIAGLRGLPPALQHEVFCGARAVYVCRLLPFSCELPEQVA